MGRKLFTDGIENDGSGAYGVNEALKSKTEQPISPEVVCPGERMNRDVTLSPEIQFLGEKPTGLYH